MKVVGRMIRTGLGQIFAREKRHRICIQSADALSLCCTETFATTDVPVTSHHHYGRSNFMFRLAPNSIVLTLLLFGPGSVCLSASHDAPLKPNIIYIMVDDLGYGDVGCFGQTQIQTPNIDRLAREGMKLTDHYSGHTVCRPSRLVLWTGKHVGHTGLQGNRQRNLSPEETTVAGLLQKQGYTTGGVGKWALGNVLDPSEIDNMGHPNRNGFDYWFGYLNQSNAHNSYPTFLWENDQQVAVPGNVIDPVERGRGRISAKRVTHSHDVMTTAALKFVRDHATGPFLLHIHWTIPHANNERGRVYGDGMEIDSYGAYGGRDWPNPEKGFAAMITHMDRDVGRVMAELKDLGIDQDTLVIFTSDNGPHNEGGHSHEFFDSNGPLQGFKRSMHEGGIRVPTIAHWPGQIAAGSTSAHPSAFFDFLPTACELAGAHIPADIDGISYLPTLLGHADDQQQHEYMYWASSEGATSVGVRFGKWKLVRYRNRKSDSNAPADWRLYDLSSDLAEQNNQAAAHPDIVQQILRLLSRDGLL